MKKNKYSELLVYEKRIKNLYKTYGLNFNPINRISQYFSYLTRIEQARQTDKDSFHRLIESNKAKYYFSLFYVSEICSFVKALENAPQEKKVVKEKLFDLAKGTYLLSEESNNNKKARDTRL